MYNDMTIDWITYSLKPDQLAENKRDVDLAFIIDFLNLKSEMKNFENRGGRNGYPTCWQYNGVSIMCPAPEHYERMGYCVMMSGDGLRWYKSLFRDFNMADYLKSLRKLTETGLSLNISRLDIAIDDKPDDAINGILDLDVITEKAIAKEYVSTSRTKCKIREIVQYKGDNISGRTIYFGSRKSTSFIRIYDKAAEQGVSGHWIRVEFEFKQETAMRIVNAICETGDNFPKYFAEVANHYLRFIELDDKNRSRCSVSAFWSKFLGTVERSSLAILGYKRNNVTRLLSYVLNAMAPSLYTLSRVMPVELLESLIVRNATCRLKQKHREMMKNPDIWDVRCSNSEKWELEMPVSLAGQLSMA